MRELPARWRASFFGRRFSRSPCGADVEISGRSSAWLERYVRDVEVARSNRVAPIDEKFVCFPSSGHVRNDLLSGRSSAWLERYVRDVEVARSNRVAPIIAAS